MTANCHLRLRRHQREGAPYVAHGEDDGFVCPRCERFVCTGTTRAPIGMSADYYAARRRREEDLIRKREMAALTARVAELEGRQS